MRKLVLGLTLICFSTPTFALSAYQKQEVNRAMDAAVKGCNERYGTYHKDERDTCVMQTVNYWWHTFHPDWR